MNTSPGLKVLIQNIMSDLIATNGLSIIEVSDSEVLLNSDSYAIDISADRDGVSMVYFDKASDPVKGYNVFLFLLNKRRSSLVFSTNQPQTTTYTEFIENQLSSLVQHLWNAGQDILSGSKAWIREYSFPVLRPDQKVSKLILQQASGPGSN